MASLRLVVAACCLMVGLQAIAKNPENGVSGMFQNPTISSGGTNYFCAGSSLLLTASIAETYQWYKNGIAIPGATGQTLDVTENGYYKVAATYAEGPNGTSAQIYIKQGNVWTGAAGDDNWYTPANWSCGVAPSANDHVEVAEMGDDYPIISDASTFTVFSLKLNEDAQLKVEGGSTLVVTDVIEVAPSAQLILSDDASLVQINDVNNIGSITAHKVTTPMKRYDFTYWSSPVAGQTLYDLSPNTMADKYYSYSPEIGNWISHMNGAQTMAEGVGYIVRAPQSFSTSVASTFAAQFVGTPNNGTVLAPVAVGITDMNLLGNPYPSAIDMDAFLMEANNASVLDGTVYLWTHNSAPTQTSGGNTYTYTSNDYAAYNLLGGIQTSTIGNNAKPTGKVASGQAFFIKGLNNGQAVFDNSMRVTGQNDQFFRADVQEKHRLWLNLANSQGAFKQTMLGYIHGATDGIDRNYDGAPFNANAFVDFYSLVNDKQLAIQGRGLPFDDQAVIPLGYSTTVPGMFTISIDHLDGLFETQDIFLHDYELDLTYDLKNLQIYMFGTSMGTFNNRFELRFNNSSLSAESFGIVTAAADGSQFKLKASSEMASVTISDLSGRVVFQRENVNARELVIDGIRKHQTVYFIKVKLANGKIAVKKVM